MAVKLIHTSLTKQNNFTQETNRINGSNSITDQKRVLSGVSSHIDKNIKVILYI